MQVFFFIILIYSIILHEVAHGYVAEKLGDPTARYAGRLTLNPLPHIDILGSIIMPLMSLIAPGSFLFGWAKPVPYNPYNLTRSPKWGEALVAGAGPLTNFLLALVFVLIARLSPDPTVASISFMGVVANIWLGILNLVPIPPLDGSKVFDMLLPLSLRLRYLQWRARMEMNPMLGFSAILIILLLFGGYFGSLVYSLASLLAGI